MQVTSHEVTVTHLFSLRLEFRTDLLGVTASGVEATSRGRIHRTGHIPRENDTLPLPSNLRQWDGSYGVRVFWIAIQLILGSEFHDFAQVHDGNAVTDMFHYTKGHGR